MRESPASSESRLNPDKSTAAYFDGRAAEWSEHYQSDPRFARRFNLIKELLQAEVFSKRNFGTAIDVGCGSGVFTELIASYGWKVVGIDLSKEMIEQASRRNAIETSKGILPSFRQGTVESLQDIPDRYDLVVSFSMIEYVEHDLEALNILTKLLTPEGVLVISVPNRSGMIRKLERMANAVRRLSGNKVFTGRGEYLSIQKHQYTATELDRLLAQRGLVKKRAKYLNAAFAIPERMIGLFEKSWWAAMYIAVYTKPDKLS